MIKNKRRYRIIRRTRMKSLRKINYIIIFTSIIIIVGAIFIIVGIFKIIMYIQNKGSYDLYNYDLIYGILAIVIGIVAIIYITTIGTIFRIIIPVKE